MKFFLRSGWRIGCVIVVLIFLVSAFSSYIQPALFSPGVFFTLAFPYLFLLMVLLTIINFIVNKKLGFILLICICCGIKNLFNSFAFNLPKQWVNYKSDSTLRIMTWNVEDFVNLLNDSKVHVNMLQLIQQTNPDVLCVQEYTEVVNSPWRVSINKALDSLGYTYQYLSKDQVRTKLLDADAEIRGVAIFSKTAFIDTGRINIRHDYTDENLIYATINFNKKPIKIFTAHLASYQLYNDTTGSNIYKITYHRKRSVEHLLREKEQLHQQEAIVIRKMLNSSAYPTIYCGDMNATPCSYNYRIIKGNSSDAFLAKGSGIGTTFYKILPTLRIDYCFTDKAFKVEQCTVIKRKLSDHYPVVTDIRWK